MRYAYPIVLETQAEGGFTVTFPDVPGAISEGETREQALRRGGEALVSMLSFMVEDNEALPRPSPAGGRPLICVTAIEAVKLALNEALRTKRMSNIALAEALGTDEKAVRRLRDVLHPSKMGELERALSVLGKQVVLEVRDAA